MKSVSSKNILKKCLIYQQLPLAVFLLCYSIFLKVLLYNYAMLSIIYALVLALLIALFATQNTGPVMIKLLPLTFFSVPTYVLVIVSMIVGLLIGSIFHLTKSLGTFIALKRKDALINKSRNENIAKDEVIRNLEEENARLKSEEAISVKPRLSI